MGGKLSFGVYNDESGYFCNITFSSRKPLTDKETHFWQQFKSIQLQGGFMGLGTGVGKFKATVKNNKIKTGILFTGFCWGVPYFNMDVFMMDNKLQSNLYMRAVVPLPLTDTEIPYGPVD